MRDLSSNLAELAVGNIVRRVLHIIREEEISIATNSAEGVEAPSDSDDNDDRDREGLPALSAAVGLPYEHHRCIIYLNLFQYNLQWHYHLQGVTRREKVDVNTIL